MGIPPRVAHAAAGAQPDVLETVSVVSTPGTNIHKVRQANLIILGGVQATRRPIASYFCGVGHASDTLTEDGATVLSLAQVKKLKKLDLRSTLLAALPEGIGQAKALQVLFLSNNRLTSIPAELAQAKNLKKLDLSMNLLATLPEEIGQAKALKTLYLGGNRITSIPGGIGEAKGLKMLNLRRNQLTDLPVEIAKLRNLRHLCLADNRFTEIPRALLNLPARTEIDLRGNPLPQAEILAIRVAIQERRAAGQTVPQLIMPRLEGEGAEDLRAAAVFGMNVHHPTLTDAFKNRLDQVARQFPMQLHGNREEQRAQLKDIENRLIQALEVHAQHYASDPRAFKKAGRVATRMFQKGQGDKEAFWNDFKHSAGHVLAYTFLSLEAQLANTPDAHKAEAQNNAMTSLIQALQNGTGACDTRLCEEVMQVIGLPLSGYAQTHPEVMTITAPTIGDSQIRDVVVDEAKKILRNLTDSNKALITDLPPPAWRETVAQQMQRDHKNITPEQVATHLDTISSYWTEFHQMVIDQDMHVAVVSGQV